MGAAFVSNASRAARESALVVDASARGSLLVTGPDRLRWLEGLLTCAVSELGVGEGTWGLLLSRQGKIRSDAWVVGAEGRVILGLAPGTAPTLYEGLERMLVMEDAELAEASADLAWIVAHGPRAATLVAAAAADLEGAAAARLDWLGIGGGALIVPRGRFESAMTLLAGLEPGVVVACAEDLVRLRVEHAWPEFGTDYGSEDNPHQAGLDQRAVSWTKGCYLGQEVVCKADMRGKVRRRLALAVLETPVAPAVGAEVRPVAGGESIGTVTSSTVSEVHGCGLALVRVHRVAVEERASVLVDGIPGRLAEAL